MPRFLLLALLTLVPPARAAEPAWEKLTAARWREIVNEVYGPPKHWSADDLFRHYAARALAGLPARYEPRYPPRLYNGTRPDLIGKLGPATVLVDVRPGAAPLGFPARQEHKQMIDWLNEERTTAKGGEISHGVLVVVTPQLVATPKGGKATAETPLYGALNKGESSVVVFSRSPGRRIFLFHAVAEYQKRDGTYHFRVGPATNLTGELTDIKGAKIPVPLPWTEGKATPVKKAE
jgi:hypothetical protein